MTGQSSGNYNVGNKQAMQAERHKAQCNTYSLIPNLSAPPVAQFCKPAPDQNDDDP